VTAEPHALLVDATTYLYRAYFRYRSLIARDGSQANGIYGLAQTLLSLLEERRSNYAVAAFDDPTTPTFRQALFPAYKQGRAAVPERLLPQFPEARELARAMGFHAVVCPGFEADDLLATLTRWLRERSISCTVVGEDKDLAQLVGPGVRLRRLETGELLDEAGVRERYGVPPERIADLLALQGDPVDGIPGVPDIGERSARRLLATPGPVSGLWDDPQALDRLQLPEAALLAVRLREGRDAFRLSRELATLREDVPLDLSEADLRYPGIDAPAVRSLFEQLGFDQLRDRIFALPARGEPAEVERHE
jgi:5'-3' exonuclease